MNYTSTLTHTRLLEDSASRIQRATRRQLNDIQAVWHKAKAEHDGAASMLQSIIDTTAAAYTLPQALQQATQAANAHAARLQELQAMIEAQATFLDGLEAMTGHNGSRCHED